MFSEEFLDTLLAKINIVDVVRVHISLRESGGNVAACCPFHPDSDWSLLLHRTEQYYHCNVCGAHGSAIGFVMQYSGKGFDEAVEELSLLV